MDDTKTTTEQAIAWFEYRVKSTPMPGARSMFKMALSALRAQQEKSRVEWIRVDDKLLPLEELLAQLAEEAAELSFAALKYRRALDRTNPTPLTADEAFDLLKEEVSDVLQLLDVLGVPDDETTTGEILTMQDAKYDRWIDRIEEAL